MRSLQELRQYYGSGDDNDWTFGQIIPLVLLAKPVLSIVKTLYQQANMPAWVLGWLRESIRWRVPKYTHINRQYSVIKSPCFFYLGCQ